MDFLKDIANNSRELIETCDLITTRIRKNYVLMVKDGSCLHTDGIHDFPVAFGSTLQMSVSRNKLVDLLKHVREQNPDNSAVMELEIRTLQEAAVIQRAKAQDILTRLEEMK